jgi:hypothetical protein
MDGLSNENETLIQHATVAYILGRKEEEKKKKKRRQNGKAKEVAPSRNSSRNKNTSRGRGRGQREITGWAAADAEAPFISSGSAAVVSRRW